jgi:hypothetical protein
MLVQAMSRYNVLDKVTSGNFSLGQVRSCYVRLGQDNSWCIRL